MQGCWYGGDKDERIIGKIELIMIRRRDIYVVIERLRGLQKWCGSGGLEYGHTPTIDWEEDEDGDWIKVEDIKKLIEELESNAP